MTSFDANSALFLTVILGAELAIAIAVTPRLVTWYLKRNLPKILDELAEDKPLLEKLKKSLFGSFFGTLGGGRPMSWSMMGRAVIGQALEKFLGGADSPLKNLLGEQKVTE